MRPRSPPSSSMSAADRLVSLLNDAIVAEDNAAVIDAGNKLLALDSSDSDAFHAVVTAHLNENTRRMLSCKKCPSSRQHFRFSTPIVCIV